VYTIALSPNGKTVASGSEDGTVKLWDTEMRKVIAKWTGHTGSVLSLRWSADGMRLVSGSSLSDGTIRVWEMESGETVLSTVAGLIKTRNNYVYAVAYSPDSSNIATGGIWDTTTGKRLSTLKQDSPVNCWGWQWLNWDIQHHHIGANRHSGGSHNVRQYSIMLFYCCRMIASLQVRHLIEQHVCGISTQTSQSVHLYSIKTGSRMQPFRLMESS